MKILSKIKKTALFAGTALIAASSIALTAPKYSTNSTTPVAPAATLECET